MRKKLVLLGALACLVTVAITSYAAAEYYLYLGNVPLYCQRTDYYCGAASAQMTLNGYPNVGDRRFFNQQHVYSRIQAHNREPASWYSDPQGVQRTLMELNRPPGGTWSIFSENTNGDLMYNVFYWMAERRYPTPVLVNRGDHWVIITGFTTNVDPRTNSNVTLEWIEINNPWPPCTDGLNTGGVHQRMTGANWYSNYLDRSIRWGATWHGRYVAVIEPPPVRGTVEVPGEVEKGMVISRSEAIELAMKWIDEYRLYEREPYKILREVRPIPWLTEPVNRDYKGYYMVPFGYNGQPPSQVAIILNAYTGNFQEVGAFEQPIEYLSMGEAVIIALRDIGIEIREIEKAVTLIEAGEVGTALVFQPSEQMQNRFLPVWRITHCKTDITLFIAQDRKVYNQLTPLSKGGI